MKKIKYFGASWCGPCKSFKPIMKEIANDGYNEVNLATNKVCLGIDFKDGDSKNWLDGNIRLLCANCYYSFNGYFPSAKKFCK